jgi:hypothetical protein
VHHVRSSRNRYFQTYKNSNLKWGTPPPSEIQETTTYKSLGKMFQNLLIKQQQTADNPGLMFAIQEKFLQI